MVVEGAGILRERVLEAEKEESCLYDYRRKEGLLGCI